MSNLKKKRFFIYFDRYTPSADPIDLGFCLSYSMIPMSKSSTTSPSSNHPIVCPLCHPDLALPAHFHEPPVSSKKKKVSKRPAVWKYNMEFHFRDKHRGSEVSAGLLKALAEVPHEVDRLKETKGLKNATF